MYIYERKYRSNERTVYFSRPLDDFYSKLRTAEIILFSRGFHIIKYVYVYEHNIQYAY